MPNLNQKIAAVVTVLLVIAICLISVITGQSDTGGSTKKTKTKTNKTEIKEESTDIENVEIIINGWHKTAMDKLLESGYGNYSKTQLSGMSKDEKMEAYKKVFTKLNVGHAQPSRVSTGTLDKKLDVTLNEAVTLTKKNGYNAFVRNKNVKDSEKHPTEFYYDVKGQRGGAEVDEYAWQPISMEKGTRGNWVIV